MSDAAQRANPLLTCPVCSTPLQPSFKLRYQIQHCPGCDLYTAQGASFDTSFTSNISEEDRLPGIKNIRVQNFKTIITELKAHFDTRISSIKGLEVGPAYGWWLQQCRADGITCTGIEPEPFFSKFYKEPGFEVYPGFYPDQLPANQRGSYDFIIFNDVFEHIPDINSLMENLVKDLRPGGLLIINIPMSSGIIYRMASLLYRLGKTDFMTRLWQFNFHSPHFNYFNENNLRHHIEHYGLSFKKSQNMVVMDFDNVESRIKTDKTVGDTKAKIISSGLRLTKPFFNSLPSDIKCLYFTKS